MKISKQEEEELLKVYNTWLFSYLNGDVKTYAHYLDEDYHFVGSTNNEEYLNKQDTVDFFEKTAEQLAGKTEIRNNKRTIEKIGELVFITEVLDAYFKDNNEWKFYGRFRFTSALQNKKEGWRFIYQHFSTPDTKAQEGETIGYNQISEENLKLREAIKRRTLELEQKNRELEIETALERVRASSLAMHKSSEMQSVANAVYEELLGLSIEIDAVGMSGVIEARKDYDVWIGGSPFSDPIRIPFNEATQVQRDYNEVIEQRPELFAKTYSGEIKKEYIAHLLQHGAFAEDLEKKMNESTAFSTSISAAKNSGIQIVRYTDQPYTHLENEILKRFAKVFEQAYIRFMDLQKSEAQAREAQIEAALEKVRSRSLSMHKSTELGEVITVVVEKLKELGFYTDDGVALITFTPGSKDLTEWMTNPGFNSASNFLLPHFDHPVLNNIWTAKEKGEEFIFKRFSPEESRSFHEYIFTHTDFKDIAQEIKDYCLAADSYATSSAIQKNTAIFINDYSGRNLTEDEVNILKRFSKVFEQAYIRFMDLQKAEEQAREAQIEAALERVRSRSLAMHNSDELKDIILLVLKSLGELGIDMNDRAAGILTFEKGSKDYYQWAASGEYSTIISFLTPYIDHPVQNDIWNARERGTAFYAKSYTVEEKNTLFQYFYDNTELKSMPEEDKERSLGFKYYDVAIAFGKNSALALVSHSGVLLTEDENEIVIRFAKVFEQAYIRFLDLQKAEAQAREAQISLSLERVRSRSMAMHSSTELLDVVKLLYGEFKSLEVYFHTVVLNLNKDSSKDLFLWISTEDGMYENIVHWPYVDIPIFHKIYHAWKSDEILEYSADKKATKQFFDEYFKVPSVPQERKKAIENVQVIEFAGVYLAHTGLLLLRYEQKPYTDAEKDIIKRFAKEFEATYTRFLDLQKAEAQAREAQIEAALEKVRSVSLSMQTTNELGEVVKVIVEKLKDLGVVLDANGVVLCTYFKDSKDVLHWIVSPDFSFAGSYLLPYFDHPIFKAAWESKESGVPYFSKAFTKEEKDSFFRYAFEHSDYKQFPDDFKKWVFQNDKHILSFAWQKNSAILIPSHTGVLPSEDDVEILKRFAKVFEQSYTRFLDLKKAEALTRETQIELSLERIRSQAMAMQQSTDLLDIVVTMRSEFEKLGHEAHYFWHMRWLPEKYEKAMTSGDGTRIGMVMELPRRIHGEIPALAAWEKGNEPIVVHVMNVEETLDYIHKMVEWGNFQQVDPNMPTEDDIRHIGGLTYVMARTMHGEIGYSLPGMVPDPPEDDIRTLKRFAGVFDLAYRRFEDLKKAEQRNRETQIELSLERIRSQALAMKESSDLFDIVVALRKEFIILGHRADYFWHMRWLPDKYEMSMTSEDGNRIGMVITVPKFVHDEIQELATWEKGNDPVFVLALDADAAWAYVDKMNTYGQYQLADPNAASEEDIHHIGGLTFIIARTMHGEIGYSLPGVVPDPPKEDINTLIRFAGVFDLAYRRFIDLQEAEKRNRETQIELALEKVRSQTMAMQKSNELPEAANLLFLEVQKLGIPSWSCGYNILSKDKRSSFCIMSSEGELQIPFKLPLTEHESLLPWHEAIINNEDFFVYEQGGEDLVEHYRYMKSLPELKATFQQFENAGIPLPTFQINHLARFNHGFLLFITYEPVPESHYIFMRFAKVFEQTYTRFLDLQKAEEQAREAQIEAALERVRSIALGLNKSDDLLDVAEALYHQLYNLGFTNIRNAIIDIHTDDDGGFLDYDYSPEMGKTITSMSYNDHPIIERQVQEIHASSDGFFEIILEGQDLEDLIQLRIKNGEKPDLRLNQARQLTYNLYSFGKGEIGISTFGVLSNDQKEVLKRFRNVFTFAYTRYSDLAQAEQLAKQAKIDLENLIAAKKKTDEALDELKATQTQLIQAEKMASLGELTAGIAHEIQNPLNFVNNFSEVSKELLEELMDAIRKGDNEEAKEITNDIVQNLEKINHHGKRADGIVKGMLQHSRSNSGSKEPTDINALADEYLRLAYHGLRAKDKSFNVNLKTEFDKTLEKVNIVPQDMGRAILNLITNAFYVVNEKKRSGLEGYEPTVSVSTKKVNGKVEIQVADNGNGIPQKVLDKIFQPFFTTKPTGQGTGLGLSLSYDIVKAHGGSLQVETTEGEGSSFILQLPTT